MITRPAFVIDASVTMAWCFEDESDSYADAVLDALAESGAAVPSIWALEVANVLLVAERRGRITPRESEEFVRLLSELPIQTQFDDPTISLREILVEGRMADLTAYDTASLILAKSQRLPMATLDSKLRLEAEKLGVALFRPANAG